MQTSPEVDKIAEALAAAQGKFQNPDKNRTVEVKTKTGGTYSFAYATLDQILDIVRPVLSDNKIAFIQVVDGIESPVLVTRIIHASGQWIESSLLLQVDGPGNQQLGSAITYLRRYGLISLLGLAAEEDDDGNLSMGNSAQPKPRQTQPARQEPRPSAPKQTATSSARTTVASNSKSPDLPAFNANNGKASCEPWFHALRTMEGENFAGAIWKHTASDWKLRYGTLRDMKIACENIRHVLGAEHGSGLIGDTINNFTMDPDGVQKIRAELNRASNGEMVGGK